MNQFDMTTPVHRALVEALKEILPGYLGQMEAVVTAATPTTRGNLSPEGRKRLSLALKRRWAAYKRGTGKSPTGLRRNRNKRT